MKRKQITLVVWETRDGMTFLDREAACRHEDRLASAPGTCPHCGEYFHPDTHGYREECPKERPLGPVYWPCANPCGGEFCACPRCVQ